MGLGPKVEQWPDPCPGNGGEPHPRVEGETVVGWSPCICGGWKQPAGHRTYWCQTCGAVVEVPPCTRVGNTTDQMGLTPPSHTGL